MLLSTLVGWLFATSNVALAAVIGIDYGQEFVKSSLVAPGAPFEMILSADSKRKELAGITFKTSDDNSIERAYGNAANNLFARFPQTSLFYPKQLLGRCLNDVSVYRDRFPAVDLIPASNNRSAIALHLKNNNLTIEEVIAMQLDDIQTRATALLASTGYSSGSSVRDVALTVPPHFDLSQRRALSDAVEIAGLRLISLVNDGVAVAVNFASTRQFTATPEYHIIYDVGAGSTTATLVSFSHEDITVDENSKLVRPGLLIDVVGLGYDENIGGQLFTSRLRDILIDRFIESVGSKNGLTVSDVKSDPKAYNKFWKEADRVKTVLSANNEAVSSIESVKSDLDFKTKIKREEFEESLTDIKDQFSKSILKAINRPLDPLREPLTIKDINSVILVGGSSRVPLIQQNLIEAFGGDASVLAKNVNADEAPALGATLRGVGISKIFRSKDMQIIDRTIWDYELEDDDRKIPLFARGSPLGSTLILPVQSNVNLNLLENGKHVSTFEISGVEQAIEDLKKDPLRKCLNESDISASATFKLNLDRTIEVSEVSVKCLAQERSRTESGTDENEKTVFTGSASDESSETTAETGFDESSQATAETASRESSETTAETASISTADDASTSTASTSTQSSQTTAAHDTKTEPRISTLKKPLKITTKSIGSKGMGYALRSSAIRTLRNFNRQDILRLEKEQLRNDLESLFYQTREYMFSNEIGNDNDLLELNKFADWIDESSHNADAAELAKQTAELKKFRDDKLKLKNTETEKPEGVAGTIATEPHEEIATATAEPVSELEKKIQSYTELVEELDVLLKKGSSENGPSASEFLGIEGYISNLNTGGNEESLAHLVEESTEALRSMINAAKKGDVSKLISMKAMIQARMREQKAGGKTDFKGLSALFDEAIKSIEVGARLKEEERQKTVSHDEL